MTGTPLRAPGAPSPPRTSLAVLRDALERAEFTTERIETVLGSGELSGAPEEADVHRRRLGADDPFATIARLFLLGEVVETGEVESALEPFSLESLADLGVIPSDREEVRA